MSDPLADIQTLATTLPPPFPAQHRRISTSRRLIIAVGIVLAFLLSAYGVRQLLIHDLAAKNPLVAKGLFAQMLPDVERAAVDLWLKNNLNDPSYTEVKWWPARESLKVHELRLIPLRAEVANSQSLLKGDEKSADNMQTMIDSKPPIDQRLPGGAPSARGGRRILNIVDGDNGVGRRLMEQQDKQQELYLEELLDAIAKDKQRLKERESELKEAEAIPAPRLCRLKYRTKLFGSLILHDQVFRVVSGGVVPADSNEQSLFVMEFPD